MERRALGRYRLGELLGRGAFAEVYRAFEEVPGEPSRPVAIKILRAGATDRAAGEHLAREARVIARLQHRQIVKLLDFACDDGVCYLVTELIEGVSARALIRQPQDLPLWAGLKIGVEIADALAHAHGLRGEDGQPLGIIHRDVKPENILIDELGTAKLLDFGLGKASRLESDQLTRDTAIKGTPAYMSPEQRVGGAVTAAADLHALGITVYELCTGIRPEPGEVPEPSRYRPEIPEAVDAILLRALEAEPSARPSAEALRVALADALAALKPVGVGPELDAELRDWLRVARPAGPEPEPRPRPVFKPRTRALAPFLGETRFTGEILQETYLLERVIGRGAMGIVYEASHRRLTRRFAIKLLFAQHAANPVALARFEREAQIAGSLGHPHIVEVIDLNRTSEGRPYIVMELLVGEDLAVRLDREHRLPLADAVEIARQTASALQAVHEIGVVHRDLKPHNIFLCRREGGVHVKVVDFGVSKMVGPGEAMTRSGTLLGTPHYMPPEQAQDRIGEVDARTDVYALAAIFYKMLAGRPPFQAESVPGLLYKILHDPLPPLRELCPELPEAIARVIERALSKEQDSRQPSMLAFWRELAGATGHLLPETIGSAPAPRPDLLEETLPPEEPIPPIPDGATLGERTDRAPGRRRRVLLYAALGGLAVGAGFLVSRPRPPPEPASAGAAEAGAVARHGPDLGSRAEAAATPARDAAAIDRPRPAAEAGVRRALQAELTLSTVEEGDAAVPAWFSLDGEDRGQTPALVPGLRARTYRLVVEAPGFRRVETRLVLRPGRNPVRIKLTR